MIPTTGLEVMRSIRESYPNLVVELNDGRIITISEAAQEFRVGIQNGRLHRDHSLPIWIWWRNGDTIFISAISMTHTSSIKVT